jgi:hypothetical protein
MKRLVLVILLSATLASSVAVFAQDSISLWPFYVEVTPRAVANGAYDLVVPLQVMNRAREDLSDLRLYDARGAEIPFALRIRRDVDDKQEISARLFNQASAGPATSEVSLDLGENAGEHNEVEIETPGTNFRRRVELEGSDSGKEWKALTSNIVFSFQSESKAVASNRVSYPASRYRYLRVRVFADEMTDKKAPVITRVKVTMAIHEKGELTMWGVAVPGDQLLRSQGAPASSWTIDLGARVPCDRLIIDTLEDSFSRPFQIEAVDDPENIHLIASGELTRRIGEERRPLNLFFGEEAYARKLRLVITDYNNRTLTISAITAAAPARQLVYGLKDASAQALRLFFGNPRAIAPHYDFETELPPKLASEPVHSDVGLVVRNPDYKPAPLPLTERIPWLIYVVLSASSLALALILISLMRSSLRTEPKITEIPS